MMKRLQFVTDTAAAQHTVDLAVIAQHRRRAFGTSSC